MGGLRVHGNAAYLVEHVGRLTILHADRDWYLETQASAVYVRLHFMSLLLAEYVISISQ